MSNLWAASQHLLDYSCRAAEKQYGGQTWEAPTNQTQPHSWQPVCSKDTRLQRAAVKVPSESHAHFISLTDIK